jgi:hypothetical protein
MRAIAGRAEHVGGVAAHQHGLAGPEAVMVIEIEGVRVLGQGAAVDGDVPVVLTPVLPVRA